VCSTPSSGILDVDRGGGRRLISVGCFLGGEVFEIATGVRAGTSLGIKRSHRRGGDVVKIVFRVAEGWGGNFRGFETGNRAP